MFQGQAQPCADTGHVAESMWEKGDSFKTQAIKVFDVDLAVTSSKFTHVIACNRTFILLFVAACHPLYVVTG